MPLYDYQHTTEVQKALTDAILVTYDDIRPVSLYDFDNVPASYLPYLYKEFAAEFMYTEIAGVPFTRKILKAWYPIAKYIGSIGAAREFAKAADFDFTYVYEPTGPIKTSVDFYVTPSVYHAPDDEWKSYITRVLKELFGGGDITVSNVYFTERLTATLYIGHHRTGVNYDHIEGT